MSRPPSTLRTHAEPEDPSQQSLSDDPSPSLQALIRLQIFTPLTLLVALGCCLVTAFAFHPNLGEISHEYETIWTPKKELIGGYLLLMFVLQICYCLVITLARGTSLREMVVKGVGLRLCLANVLLGLWAVFWILKYFLVSEILLLVATFFMLTVWLTLLPYPVSSPFSAPVSWMFVHVPVRMLLLFLTNIAIWQNGLIALGWYKYHGSDPDHRGKWEKEHETHAWIAFGVITALGLINSFIVFLGKDIAWAACTIFLSIAMLLGTDKPVMVVVPLILTAALQVVALIAAWTRMLYESRKTGAIRLEEDNEEDL